MKQFLKKLMKVCDWAERNQIYLIIDNHNNHTFDPFGQWTYTNNDFIFCKNILNQSGLRLRYVIKTEVIISFTKLLMSRTVEMQANGIRYSRKLLNL